MILDLEQIKGLTVGAVDVEKKEDGVHFYKMQKCQIDAFYALSDILGFRAETTTGIRLDFETDSKFLAFESKKETDLNISFTAYIKEHSRARASSLIHLVA